MSVNYDLTLKPIGGDNIGGAPVSIVPVKFKYEHEESLIVTTIDGMVWKITHDGRRALFLDIKNKVLNQGPNDPRGLLGIAFQDEPEGNKNNKCKNKRKFYVYYSSIKDNGSSPPVVPVVPVYNETKNQEWINRNLFDHPNYLDEYKIDKHGCPVFNKTILKIKQPFQGNNGYNNLKWDYSNKKLILATGDGGYFFDPFNLSQSDNEIYGKLLMIDPDALRFITSDVCFVPNVSRLSEIVSGVNVLSKGLRNPSSIFEDRLGLNYVADNGEQSADEVNAFGDWYNNFGWRQNEGQLPTFTNQVNLVEPYDPTVTILPNTGGPYTFQKSWNTNSFNPDGSGEKVEIFISDSIRFFATDGNIHNLVSSIGPTSWEPQTPIPEVSFPNSTSFDNTIKFNNVGVFYFIDQRSPTTSRIEVIVKDSNGDTINNTLPLVWSQSWDTSAFPSDGSGVILNVFRGDSVVFNQSVTSGGLILSSVGPTGDWLAVEPPEAREYNVDSIGVPIVDEYLIFDQANEDQNPVNVYLVDPTRNPPVRLTVVVNYVKDRTPLNKITQTMTFTDEVLNNLNNYKPFVSAYKSDHRDDKVRPVLFSGSTYYRGDGIKSLKNKTVVSVFDTYTKDVGTDGQRVKSNNGTIISSYVDRQNPEHAMDYSVSSVNFRSIGGFPNNYLTSIGTNEEGKRIFVGVCSKNSTATDSSISGVYELVESSRSDNSHQFNRNSNNNRNLLDREIPEVEDYSYMELNYHTSKEDTCDDKSSTCDKKKCKDESTCDDSSSCDKKPPKSPKCDKKPPKSPKCDKKPPKSPKCKESEDTTTTESVEKDSYDNPCNDCSRDDNHNDYSRDRSEDNSENEPERPHHPRKQQEPQWYNVEKKKTHSRQHDSEANEIFYSTGGNSYEVISYQYDSRE